MPRKKDAFAKLIDWIIPDGLLTRLNGKDEDKLLVLAYHRICDFNKGSFDYDMELISASTRQFEFQVKFICEYFNPISLTQLEHHIRDNASLPKNAVLLTFDDGFDDNYHHAYPILKKYNCPATIFVSTDYISSERTIWFDQLAAVIRHFPHPKLAVKQLDNVYDFDNDDRERIIAKVLSDFKTLKNADREAALEEIFTEHSDVIETLNHQQSKMLSWDQVREMDASLIDFGSHTVTHPVLTQLDEQGQHDELEQSRKTLETQLSHPVVSISYPDGTEKAFNKTTLAIAKECGYQLGFSYLSGINPLPLREHLALKRLHVEHYIDNSHFKALLCLPTLFGEH